MEALVPMWRKNVADFASLLSYGTLKELPSFVTKPGAIMDMVPRPKGRQVSAQQLDARAMDVLFCSLVLCLVDHGWVLISEPGDMRLEHGESRLDAPAAISDMKSGKLTAGEWESWCAQRGMGDWALAGLQANPPERSHAAY